MARSRRTFGQITRLPSRRWRARYTGPDTRLHSAPHTFTAKIDAEGWLVAERRLIESGTWTPPRDRAAATRRGPVTFGPYADAWLSARTLRDTTRGHYRRLLDDHLRPTFGDLPVSAITPARVRDWHARTLTTRPTMRAHAYQLLRTILGTAVEDGELAANPCRIRGAGSTRRAKRIRPATLDELETIAAHMPARYRPMVLLAAWCGLRFGELAELRRRDVDLTNGVLRVRRGVSRAGGRTIVGDPKTDAGKRDVAIPPHLLPMLRDHLGGSIAGGRDGLLFPAADGRSNMAPSTLYRVFYPARDAAGRPDLRFHDLRHTGAVLAAQTGATLAELMARLGHSSPAAAMRYQHAAQGRDAQIAADLSRIAGH